MSEHNVETQRLASLPLCTGQTLITIPENGEHVIYKTIPG
ncbi:MAG: hypothetical protein JETT_3685 [Candidatus Jettenia ecosi]|uniref:Uncharacterized protein n=1 Tax=Candidatus Jettenia ecosi TaxID=2494326 RepID=A0A533Q644_9BACT|nr:MAG: hypothetical protein JETT_3685 [Candidatus Jettenia ecosi]